MPASAHAARAVAGELAGRACEVRVAAGDPTLLAVPGCARFAIERGADRLTLAREPGAGDDAVAEALLGPALALALATRGTFLLHASAVATPHGVVAFLGASGAGKSTLAALLDAAGWLRAADDLLAVRLDGGRAEALPHLPQLKLAPAAQAALAALPASLPLAGVCELHLDAPDGGVAVEALGPGATAALVARHTVGGVLFDDDLLARHLAFAAAVAPAVRGLRLRLPKRLDVGPEVRSALAATLGEAP